ncbi:mechanosensitive ion channel family protein [Sphingomonas sp. NFX23]|uniref:mechanosensitive ion channel family protein n=1 Tax=Sphingomonas sp. NFX23 TaxID=2819532 RepID=UPI003CE87CEB
MEFSIAALALLLLIAVGSLSIRQLPLWLQLLVRLSLIAAISLLLFEHGETAFPVSRASGSGLDGFVSRALTIAWWWIGAHLAADVIALVRRRDHRLSGSRLFSDLLSGAIYLSALLFIANSILDLPVKGLVATSGVIAIVIGLALQNTLADVFSGTAVGIERFFSVGDRISVSGNVEGVVTQMNWRSVWIRTDDDDHATIPNSVIAKSQIINRGKPSSSRIGHVDFPCSNLVAPARVIEHMGYAILLSGGIASSPKPSAELVSFGATRNSYRVNFHARDTASLGAANAAVAVQIDRQLRKSGWLDGRMLADTDGGIHPPSPSLIFRGISLFDGLDRSQIEELSTAATVRTLRPHDVLFSHGSEDCVLHIVARGVVELSGRESEISNDGASRIGVGDYVGDLYLDSGKPHSLDAVALTDCVVYDLDHATLAAMAAASPALVPRFEKIIELRNADLTSLKNDTAAAASNNGLTPVEKTTALFKKIMDYVR